MSRPKRESTPFEAGFQRLCEETGQGAAWITFIPNDDGISARVVIGGSPAHTSALRALLSRDPGRIPVGRGDA